LRAWTTVDQGWPVPIVIVGGVWWKVKLLKAVMEMRRSEAEEEPVPVERMAMLSGELGLWVVERWVRRTLREVREVGRAMSFGERFLLADQVLDSET
jgi:hypothetical protein